MADALVSMKTVVKSGDAPGDSGAIAAPTYPYGLTITLDEESIAALGLSQLPEVGKAIELRARADVVSVSQRQESDVTSAPSASRDGTGTTKQRSISLQITHLAVDPDKRSDADVLFGPGKTT